MVSPDKPQERSLTEDEIKRIDELLQEAKKYHVSGLVLAGVSITIASLDKTTDIQLPLGNISLPSTQTAVGLYFLIILLSITSDRLFNMVSPWLRLDPRRLPFPWFALGKLPYSNFQVKMWLLFPIFVGAIASAITLQNEDSSGFLLSFVGLFLFLSPRHWSEYLHLISEKADERGGAATFSIFLLYCLRLLRNIVFFGILLPPIFAIVPKWREDMLRISGYAIALSLCIFVIRWIGGVRFVYKAIDRFGVRLGFSGESEHYK